MKYFEIVAQKRKIMEKFNEHNVDVLEVLRFINNARSSNCEAIADDMQRRLDDHMEKLDAGLKSWEKSETEKE